MHEFLYIQKSQQSGDIIFFDDFTEGLFDGVIKAVEAGVKLYNYELNIIKVDKNRGYAIAIKL